MRLIDRRDQVRTRWKNDGGWTREIARSPASPIEPFDWRISIAEIESDGPFSTFAQVDRELVLLGGNGIELDIGDATPVRLTDRFARARFRGEAPVSCRLVDGPTSDFNVMTRRDRIRAEVLPRPLVGPLLLMPAAATTWFVHVSAGVAEARRGDQTVRIETGSSLIVDADQRVLLDGGGELILVKLVRLGD